MLVLVAYDIKQDTKAGKKRWKTVARACEDYGQRVQHSVFECLLTPAQWENLRSTLVTTIDKDTDSLRFYLLGKNWRRRVQHVGAKPSWDPQGPLIV
jgi:CRISPR-associated protein Cas2